MATTHNINGITIRFGTAAERAALAATSVGKGSEFWETDGLRGRYVSNGTNWLILGAMGAKNEVPFGGVVIDDSGVARTVQRAFADATGAGNTAVVAAQGAGLRVRVLAGFFVATTAVTARFQSSATNISPGLPLGANGGIVLPANVHGWFQTAANEALNINLGAAVATGVMVDWIQAV